MRRMLVEAVRNMRIKPKMVLLYSVCILFQLLLFGGILFFIVIEGIRAQAVMGISQNARHINLSLDEYIKEMETISFMSYNNQQLQQHLTDLAENGGGDAAQQLKAREEIEAFLDSVLTVNDNLDYISVICSDGRFYTKSIYGPVRMQEDYLREQMQQLDASRGGITISAAHAAAYDFSPMPTVFSVGRRIMDFESGYYIGYLLLECNLNVFDRIAENTQVGQNGFWTAQAPDGGMLYSTAPEGADLSENAQDDFYIQSDTSADTGIVVRCFLPRQEVTRTARAKMFVPAHVPAAEDVSELARYNIDTVKEIGERITDILKEQQCFEQLLRRLFKEYGLTMNFEQYVLVGSTVRSYLSWLKDSGRIQAVFEDNMLYWKA